MLPNRLRLLRESYLVLFSSYCAVLSVMVMVMLMMEYDQYTANRQLNARRSQDRMANRGPRYSWYLHFLFTLFPMDGTVSTHTIHYWYLLSALLLLLLTILLCLCGAHAVCGAFYLCI
jgi:cytochrome bd-type quinol oxidase subunit 2